MVIIETTVFTRQVLKLLSDEEYRVLQSSLAERPDMGDLIKGSGGLRKVRWMTYGHGKRGGIRVIYYWAIQREQLVLLLMYSKNERDDLTSEQVKKLRTIIEADYP
jgi:mRNA-degrading endonuclease RelE of RelBE toxin-antitoxin system